MMKAVFIAIIVALSISGAAVTQANDRWEMRDAIDPMTDRVSSGLIIIERAPILSTHFMLQIYSSGSNSCTISVGVGEILTGETGTITYRIDSETPVVLEGAVVEDGTVFLDSDRAACRSIAQGIARAQTRLVVNIRTSSRYLNGDNKTHVFSVDGSTPAANQFLSRLND